METIDAKSDDDKDSLTEIESTFVSKPDIEKYQLLLPKIKGCEIIMQRMPSYGYLGVKMERIVGLEYPLLERRGEESKFITSHPIKDLHSVTGVLPDMSVEFIEPSDSFEEYRSVLFKAIVSSPGIHGVKVKKSVIPSLFVVL